LLQQEDGRKGEGATKIVGKTGADSSNADATVDADAGAGAVAGAGPAAISFTSSRLKRNI